MTEATDRDMLFHAYGYVYALEQVVIRLRQGEDIEQWALDNLAVLPRNPKASPREF